MKNKFLKDKATGKIGEDIVKKELEKYGVTVENIGEDRDRKDLKCELAGNQFLVEVKYDQKSLKTGNLFFEFKSTSELEADFIVFIHGNQFFCFQKDYAQKILTPEFGYKTLNVGQENVGSNVKYDGKIVPIPYSHGVDIVSMLLMWVHGDIFHYFKESNE